MMAREDLVPLRRRSSDLLPKYVHHIAGSHFVAADPDLIITMNRLQEAFAPASMPVLVQGETGTGKELIALAVHYWSPRAAGPFIPINCAAIPEQLLEGELFGSHAGAYSGAVNDRKGLVEAADGGVLFLDEVGELPLVAQAKLLRVLESKKVRRLGEVKERSVDIRIVAATHRELKDEVDAGRFRRDLFFRLKGAIVRLPPLRARHRDLEILARMRLTEACRRLGRAEMQIPASTLAAIMSYGWPGNVRELESFVDFAAAIARADRLEPKHLQEWIGNPVFGEDEPTLRIEIRPAKFRPIADELAELERARMSQALRFTDGNRTRAAALIDMPLRTFATKLKLYELAD